MHELHYRLVRPDGTDWIVLTPEARRASYRSDRRSEAVARAQCIIRKAGGGVVDVLDESGAVVHSVRVGRRMRGALDLRIG